MKDATPLPRRSGTGQARLELPITREGLAAALARAAARLAPFARRPADVQSIGLPASAGAQIGAMLRPISTPLLMGGFEPETVDLVFGRVSRRRLHADGHRHGGRRAADGDARPAARGRCDRRLAGQRRHRHGRDRHDHPHRRRPHLRVRPSLLQPRTRRVPDDARLRLHDPAQPADVVQDLVDGRDDRHDDAGSADGDRRHARQGPGARADDGHARAVRRRRTGRARCRHAEAHLQVLARQRSDVHAAHRLRRDVQHARLLRAAVRRVDDQRQEPRAHQGPRGI